jgi:hypothetical protein
MIDDNTARRIPLVAVTSVAVALLAFLIATALLPNRAMSLIIVDSTDTARLAAALRANSIGMVAVAVSMMLCANAIRVIADWRRDTSLFALLGFLQLAGLIIAIIVIWFRQRPDRVAGLGAGGSGMVFEERRIRTEATTAFVILVFVCAGQLGLLLRLLGAAGEMGSLASTTVRQAVADAPGAGTALGILTFVACLLIGRAARLRGHSYAWGIIGIASFAGVIGILALPLSLGVNRGSSGLQGA